MESSGSLMDRINDFLDKYILPWPVRFLTFRFVILITISLLIPLIAFANNTTLVLGLNSYLNTMSVAVSSIVLLYATVSEARQKQIAEMQEKRAQEDHTHVTEMHQLTLQTLQNQKEEIDELKKIMAQIAGRELSITASPAMPDLRDLHPRGDERFADDDISRRWRDKLHHNVLVSTIRTNLQPDAEAAPQPEDTK
jgi:ribosomal protein L29